MQKRTTSVEELCVVITDRDGICQDLPLKC